MIHYYTTILTIFKVFEYLAARPVNRWCPCHANPYLATSDLHLDDCKNKKIHEAKERRERKEDLERKRNQAQREQVVLNENNLINLICRGDWTVNVAINLPLDVLHRMRKDVLSSLRRRRMEQSKEVNMKRNWCHLTSKLPSNIVK